MRVIQTNPSKALFRTGDKMNINDRLDSMSKGELISLIKEIKITCESNRNKEGNPLKNTFNFILRLIKGEL